MVYDVKPTMTLRPAVEFSGKYWKGRWDAYLSAVADIAAKIAPTSVLEIGTNGLSLFIGAETMNIDRDVVSSTYHDAGETPWPFQNKQFDLGIATQVWEHLEGRQCQAFSELRRVCKEAVLSFPLNWRHCRQDNCHYGITRDTILEWAGGHRPVRSLCVTTRPGFSRVICHYVFA
jgi:hypothetical protein